MSNEDHSFTCHPRVYLLMEQAILAFTSRLHNITTLWPVLFPMALMAGGWVGRGGWLQYWGNMRVQRQSPIPVLTGPNVQ